MSMFLDSGKKKPSRWKHGGEYTNSMIVHELDQELDQWNGDRLAFWIHLPLCGPVVVSNIFNWFTSKYIFYFQLKYLCFCLSLGPSLCLSLVVHISSCVCLMYKDKQTFTFYHTDEQFSYVRHSTIYEYFWPNVPHLRTIQVRLLPTGSIINLCWEDIRRKPNPKSNTPSLTKCHSTTCWTSHNLEGNIFHTAIVSLTKQQLHIGSKPQNSHMK